jgi:hypothetical protein
MLHQSLSCYTERLYPDVADLVGRHVLYKIDGGPGRLAEGMLADCRAHGVYLFLGVQNTTHVTQETDQNYGLFKSDICRNIHILTSDLVTDYNHRQSLYDLNREHNRPPLRTAAVGREQYGLLLPGRDANPDLGQSALAPAFHNAFSQTKNLRSWKVCGAVPLTREALRHHSVQHEVARDATVVQQEKIDPLSTFDYQHESMLQVEAQHHKACLHLTHLGFNGDVLKRTERRRVDNLSARVSTMSSEQERIIALATSGFNLSSMFFTVDPSCLSTDSIFKAIEYKQQFDSWNQRKKERKALVDEMTIHNKRKDAAAKTKYTKADYERMLRWKMGANAFKNEAKGQTIDALKTMCEHYKDVPLDSIVLPEEEDEPAVPAIQNTALGEASADLLEGAAKPWIDNSRRDRLIKLHELIDDKLNEGGDDISINSFFRYWYNLFVLVHISCLTRLILLLDLNCELVNLNRHFGIGQSGNVK